MNPHEELLEIRRKFMHLIIGVSVAFLLHYQIINGYILIGLFFSMIIFFTLLKHYHWKIPQLMNLLKLFEREKHIKTSPGKSATCFIFGCAIAALFFTNDIAVVSILILAFGDSISNLVGHHFGKTLTPFHHHKKIEGPIAGIFISTLIASFFIPFFPALIASTVAMIFEFPEWKIFGYHLDDNIIIPLSAGGTLTLLL